MQSSHISFNLMSEVFNIVVFPTTAQFLLTKMLAAVVKLKYFEYIIRPFK